MRLSTTDRGSRITTRHYEATILNDRFMAIIRKGPRFYYGIRLISAIDAVEGLDMAGSKPVIRSPRKRGNTVQLELEVESSVWKKKTHHFVFHEDRIETYTVVRGRARVDRAYYFRAIMDEMDLGSLAGFTQVFSPQTNFIEKQEFHPGEFTSIAAGEDDVIHKTIRHFGLFGAPLCYVFHEGDSGPFLSAGILAKPGQYLFHAYEMNHWPEERLPGIQWPVVGTQALSLAYHGHLKVNGRWQTPTLVMEFANDRMEALRKYLKRLDTSGGRIKRTRPYPSWTFKPVYCTWHDQCAASKCSDEGGSYLPGRGLSAADILTQENCEKWLGILEREKLLPGSYIIDAQWQIDCGNNVVDPSRFPDLRGFVDLCHSKDVKVILHSHLWNGGGLPEEECIELDGKRIPVPDPTHPGYRKRVRAMVRRMLSGAKGCYDADGIKLDSSWYPGGRTLKTHSGLAGFELARTHQELFSRTAARIKPDSAMCLYTAFPYLADLCDFARTGDLYSVRGCPIWANEFRVRIIKLVSPGIAVDTDGELQFNVALPDEEVLAGQASSGVPCLYQIDRTTRIRDFCIPLSRKMNDADYDLIRKHWKAYERKQGEKQRRRK